MRSLADRLRLERVLRAVALVSLALWIASAAWPRGGRTAILRGDALGQALARLTIAEIPESVHVQLDTVPDARNSDWLAAMRRAGIGVSWSGTAGGALAIESFRSPEPTGGTVLLAAAPERFSVLADALGPVDTIAVANAPATIRLASVEGDLTLRSGLQPARVAAPASIAPKRVLVSGAAGWETKFVIVALEESGWSVDARIFVRPEEDVVQGGGGTLDTSRYSVVVLMDSSAAETTRGVAEFVRAGGGLVLAGDANRARRVAGLIAWRAGKRELAPLGALPGDTAWRGLSRFPLDTITDRRAIALERREGRAIVAARRHYAGRVSGVGYDQTWRWRMAGGENAVAEHRAWWSRAVASVSPAVIPILSPSLRSRAGFAKERDVQLRAGAAPRASLYDVLGAPSASAGTLPSRFPTRLLSNLLALLALTTLLSEWFLRRARGAR
jgi:hypothetical protein